MCLVYVGAREEPWCKCFGVTAVQRQLLEKSGPYLLCCPHWLPPHNTDEHWRRSMAFRLVMVAYACGLNIWEVEEGKLESRSSLAPYRGNWGQYRLHETLSANNQSNKTQIKDTNLFTGTCWKHMIHMGVPDVNVATVLRTAQSTACVSIHGSPRSGLQATGRCPELCCFHKGTHAWDDIT